MTDTTRLGLPYPADADPADVPTWMRNLATELDALIPSDAQGAIGSRPATHVRGALYTSTNEGVQPVTYRDDGTAWRRLGYIPYVTTLPTNPADGDVVIWEYNEGTANPTFWTMRWDATLNVWEYMGGNPAFLPASTPTTVIGGNAHTNILPAANPLPNGGAWMFRWGGHVRNTGLLTPNTTQTVYLGPMINANNSGIVNAIHQLFFFAIFVSTSGRCNCSGSNRPHNFPDCLDK